MCCSKTHGSLISFHFYLLFIVLTACSTNTDPVAEIDPPFEPNIDSVVINIVSGNEQVGVANQELENPLRIQVVDNDNQPVPNLSILFEIVEGNGSVTSENNIQTTDANGNAQTGWVIGANHNAIKITPANSEITAVAQFAYASTINARGMAKTKSLNTLRKEGDALYYMSFYGDYSDILESTNARYGGNGGASNGSIDVMDFYCSLFSMFGNPNEYLYGRSFDNPSGWRCLTLIGEYNPPDGYKSFAFSRMQDYGYDYGTAVENLSNEGKENLFESAFHCPDGINEKGVVAGLANVRPLNFVPDPAKESIWITLLVRKILDDAANVDEAVEIAREYNVFCPSYSSLGIHVLVADAEGKSVILEMYNGTLQVTPNNEQWQVITNSPSYNVSIDAQKAQCSRFSNIYNSLSYANGNVSTSEVLNILNRVGNIYTEWSVVYNLTEKKVTTAINYDFERTYTFDLLTGDMDLK